MALGSIEHFRGHLEVHHVAFIVLDDEQHAGALIDGLRRGDHLVGHGRGEDLAGAGGVEHAWPDEPRVQGLVARAAAGNQRHLAGRQRFAANEMLLIAEHDEVGVRRREALEALLQHRLRRVEKLLHVFPPCLVGCRRDLMCRLTA